MTYLLLNREFGAENANKMVAIREVNSGNPATIYATSTGGVISEIGLTALSPNGNLHCFVDGNYDYYINIISSATNGRVDAQWDIINGHFKYDNSISFPSGIVSPVIT